MKLSKRFIKYKWLLKPVEAKDAEGYTTKTFEIDRGIEWQEKPISEKLAIEKHGENTKSTVTAYVAKGELSQSEKGWCVSETEDANSPEMRIIEVIDYPSYTKVISEKM